MEYIFFNDAISFRTKFPFDLSVLKHFLNSMFIYFAFTVENNKNKKSLKILFL